MDKQIIEEMARIIAFDLCPNRHVHAKWGEEAQCYSDNNFAECTKIKNVVDKLYNAGYRKIPEGAVVLTREEFEKHKGFSREEVDEISETAIKNSRKETAETFAERLKENTVDEYDSEGVNHPYVILDYEELDEICKEFTGDKDEKG